MSLNSPMEDTYIGSGEVDDQIQSYKEQLIKETAEIEYKNGVITQACRDALFNYEVEITD